MGLRSDCKSGVSDARNAHILHTKVAPLTRASPSALSSRIQLYYVVQVTWRLVTHPGDTTTLLNPSFQSHKVAAHSAFFQINKSANQSHNPNSWQYSKHHHRLLPSRCSTWLQQTEVWKLRWPLAVQQVNAAGGCVWWNVSKMFWKVVKEKSSTQTQTDGGRSCKQDLGTPKSFFYPLFISLNKNNVHKLLWGEAAQNRSETTFQEWLMDCQCCLIRLSTVCAFLLFKDGPK